MPADTSTNPQGSEGSTTSTADSTPQTSYAEFQPWFSLAFLALGFTGSLMNALNVSSGSTQHFTELMFAFAGGSALLYAGLLKERSSHTNARLRLATIATLMLSVGAGLGLVLGLFVLRPILLDKAKRLADKKQLAEPRPEQTPGGPTAAPPASNSRENATAPAATAPVACPPCAAETTLLHSANACGPAKAVYKRNREWLGQTPAGSEVLTQYEQLMMALRCPIH